MLPFQRPLKIHFISISEDILTNEVKGLDSTLEQLARLQAQATVQKDLVSAAQILNSQPNKSALPNQLATRVRHILKFTYTKPSRSEVRSERLRKLECNALKFCGLVYTIRELCELSELQFEYLVECIAGFVRSRKLVQQLYRSEIDKAINSLRVPAEDEQSFRDFLQASVNEKPLRRPNVVDKDGTSTLNKPDAEPTLQVAQDFYGQLPPSERPAKRRREGFTDGASSSVESTLVASTELVEHDHLFQTSEEWSLSGNVVKLTIEDVKDVAQTDQVGSDIFLTLPLYLNTAPFITVPLSNKLALQYIVKYGEIMS